MALSLCRTTVDDSARELMGADDVAAYSAALRAFLAPASR